MLKVVGEVAGAGGVILFLVILFFRDVLTSKLAQRLSRPQAARAVTAMIFGVLGLAVVGGLTALMSNQKPGCASTTGNITITQGDTNSNVLNTGCGNTSVTR
jgi:protein-S-isoprenylcysteine O-methyltransferase Ste14